MISAAWRTRATTDVNGAPVRVTVVYASPSGYWALPVVLENGARVADALARVRDEACFRAAWPGIAGLAIFGRAVGEDAPLHDGDRIELLRPLLADPKQARRERAVSARRRP